MRDISRAALAAAVTILVVFALFILFGYTRGMPPIAWPFA